MTSSLVGSEMCIRDSFGDHQTIVCQDCQKVLMQIHRGVNANLVDELLICLLYTSDAADDM
eukprot:5998057-Prorocentrum_lima.AAC.1